MYAAWISSLDNGCISFMRLLWLVCTILTMLL
jgi:hypothetical protein